jgi:ATP-binding cassette subfamily B protein
VGEILSRLSDTARIRQLISGTTISIVLDAVFMACALCVLLLYSWKLAILALCLAPILTVSGFIFLPALRRNLRRTMEEGARLQGRFVEDVTGVQTIKAYALEARRLEGTQKELQRYMQEVFRGQSLGIAMSSTAMLTSGMTSLLLLWVGGQMVIGGELTVGQLMFSSSLVGFMMGPMERLAGITLQIQDALVALDRLGEILDLPGEAASFGHRRFEGLSQGIRLENLTFAYPGRKEVLQDLTLEIPSGASLAIVGESGSGKTTLCKLLAGFYGPTRGRLLFDGVDSRELDLDSLRGRIGWVQQEPGVFSGTVRDNIALALPDAPLSEVEEAARLSQLEEWIEGLPERYLTRIGERGINLSGGERQRLAVARAILRKPDLLIFDEATSHLDTRTERAIQDTLNRVLPGRTRVMIAHRLSTIQNADHIVVLDQGRILEQGTHESLLAIGGKYMELWSRQGPAESRALLAPGGVP